MNYLKNEQYYADLYDLATIEKCLWSINFWQKEYQNKDEHEHLKKYPKKSAIKVKFLGLDQKQSNTL